MRKVYDLICRLSVLSPGNIVFKKEIRKTILFTIALKHLGISPIKVVKDSNSWTGRTNMVKTAILSKAIHPFKNIKAVIYRNNILFRKCL